MRRAHSFDNYVNARSGYQTFRYALLPRGTRVRGKNSMGLVFINWSFGVGL